MIPGSGPFHMFNGSTLPLLTLAVFGSLQYEAQGDVGVMTNQWGLKPLDTYIRARHLRSRINLNVHDEVVASCPPDEVWEGATFLRDSLERPKVYRSPVTGADVELTIPVEFKLGTTLRPTVEYKRLPERAAFDAAVAGLARQLH